MTELVLLSAPLVVASLVLAVGFVGCFLDSTGYGTSEQYDTAVTTHRNAVSYWRLGEAAGTTAADSKGGNDGTYVGGVTLGQPGLLAGAADTAAQFDGSSGYVTVPHVDDSLNPAKFTVEALVNVAGGDGQYRAVVSSRDIDAGALTFGYILYASDQDKWEAWVGDGVGTSWQVVTGPDVTHGRHYLAMTYDGTTLTLYVDPPELAPVSADVPYQPNPTRELRIGAGANEAETPLFWFNGVIDEVAVYNAALDLATIQSHSGLSMTAPTPA